jgi:preprotein translocase subunit SecA
VVDEDLERVADLLGDRVRQLNEQEAALAGRERELEKRERRVSTGEQPAAGIGVESKPSPARIASARVVPKVGRNDLCPCGSGLKYKRCHGL